ncbi:hypothetical protein CAL7716_107860 (plasmid) [Calothrix sp. PCC 7716]|nr:hypothetical protein CAL7716_107860 [Calothrix sp. PCC 7716]
MNPIQRVYQGFSNWLERVNQEYEWDKPIRNLAKHTINIREIIPGWDDDYPEPMFTDNWELSSEIGLNQDDDFEVDIEAESEFIGFNEDETQYLNLVGDCFDCKYFHGTQYGDVDLICGIHPYGNTNCSDFEPKLLTDSVEELEPEEEPIWLTEEEELRGEYKHYYEFVKDAEWVSDDLEHYLGKYED